jgi:hypothetical protein
MTPLRFLFILLTMLSGSFIQRNRMLFGLSSGDLPSDQAFHAYTEQIVLDTELAKFSDALGDEMDAYRNHCLRVLSFAVAHLGGVKMVSSKSVDVMALALAYHDLGLWSDGALDYLEPSARQLEASTRDNSEDEDATVFDDNDIATARAIITEHHKLTDYHSPDDKGINANLVNAIRKGDWADFTIGIVRFGLPAGFVESAYTKIPEAGFHMILTTMGGRLSPDSLTNQLAILNIFKW